MPTYPISPPVSLPALLKQPQRISRDLANLVYQRFAGDRLFVRGTPEQVAGGSMIYQESESIFLDPTQDVEEIASRGDWPRTGWTEAVKQAFVKQYGLEVVINNLAIRRNQIDQFTRAEVKLANNLVRFMDTQMMTLLTTNASITTQAASALWTTNTTDIIKDIAAAQEAIETQNNGYNGFYGATLILHINRRDDLLNNTALRAALPREDRNGQIQSGTMAPFLGLREIIFTTNITQTQAILMDTTVAGTIADERPDPREGFSAYAPPTGVPPIWVKVYEESRSKDQVIAAGRWPAMALTDPKAVVLITGVA